MTKKKKEKEKKSGNLKEEDGKEMRSDIYLSMLFVISISYLQKYNAITFNCMGPVEPTVSSACWNPL